MVIALSLVLDRPVFRLLDWPDAERDDWHRLFRAMGSLWAWGFAAFAVGLLSAGPRAGSVARTSGPARGVFVFLAATIGGAAAEILKVIVRRERPDAEALFYVFRPLADRPLSGSGLGMPSSHTAVAFAGAAALCIVAPRAAPAWIFLACACGFTRLVDRAHWLSDVSVGALVGVAAAVALAGLFRPNPPAEEPR